MSNVYDMTIDIRDQLMAQELCRPQAIKLDGLAKKLEKSEMTIAVIGQFKRGKTTLVNSLLGSDLLPVGIVPITSAVTRIRQAEGAPDRTDPADAPATARVWFLNGLCEEVPAEQLHRYISEQENRDNHLQVDEVELTTDAEILRDGIVLVDTPGVGSVHEKNSTSARAFARESDAVIFMLSVDSPVNQIEVDFLRDTRRFAGRFYFVVNKIDTIDEEDLAEYLDYCNRLICGIMEIDPTGDEAKAIRLIPVSAKRGTGIAELRETLRADLARNAKQIMERSTERKILELLKSTGAQISAYREVLKMAPAVFERRFREMHGILADRIEACDRLAGGRTGADCPDDRTCADCPDDRTGADCPGGDRRLLRAGLNEEKRRLSEQVRVLFGIDIDPDVQREGAGDLMEPGEYARELKGVCRQLEETLNTIFMYKEENAYTVARRIEDMNILIRNIDRAARRLKKETGGKKE